MYRIFLKIRVGVSALSEILLFYFCEIRSTCYYTVRYTLLSLTAVSLFIDLELTLHCSTGIAVAKRQSG